MDHRDVPIGFMMSLAMNEGAMSVYASMSDQQKQAILEKAHHASSKAEMKQIVESIVTK